MIRIKKYFYHFDLLSVNHILGVKNKMEKDILCIKFQDSVRFRRFLDQQNC